MTYLTPFIRSSADHLHSRHIHFLARWTWSLVQSISGPMYANCPNAISDIGESIVLKPPTVQSESVMFYLYNLRKRVTRFQSSQMPPPGECTLLHRIDFGIKRLRISEWLRLNGLIQVPRSVCRSDLPRTYSVIVCLKLGNRRHLWCWRHWGRETQMREAPLNAIVATSFGNRRCRNLITVESARYRCSFPRQDSGSFIIHPQLRAVLVASHSLLWFFSRTKDRDYLYANKPWDGQMSLGPLRKGTVLAGLRDDCPSLFWSILVRTFIWSSSYWTGHGTVPIGPITLHQHADFTTPLTLSPSSYLLYVFFISPHHSRTSSIVSPWYFWKPASHSFFLGCVRSRSGLCVSLLSGDPYLFVPFWYIIFPAILYRFRAIFFFSTWLKDNQHKSKAARTT